MDLKNVVSKLWITSLTLLAAWVAGGSAASAQRLLAGRYLSNGNLDTTFQMAPIDIAGSNFESISAAALQGNKLVVAGSINLSNDGPGTALLVARYNPDGRLDGNFGNGGIVSVPVPLSSATFASAVVIDASGRIVVAGGATFSSADRFLIVRLTANGALDTNFGGTRGFVTTDIGNSVTESASGVAMTSTGQIVAAGSAVISNHSRFAVARYKANGDLDGGFGAGGLAFANFSFPEEIASDVAVASNGAIVAVGEGSEAGGGRLFAVARWTSLGILDPNFSGDGMTAIDFGGFAEMATGVVIDSQGRILVSGHSTATTGVSSFAAARLQASGLAAGALDTTFSAPDGKVLTTIPTVNNTRSAEACLASGDRLFVIGTARNSSGKDLIASARYTSGGALDTTFAGDGMHLTNVTGSDSETGSACVMEGTKIVFAGSSSQN